MLAQDIQSILNSIPHEIPWQDIANTDEGRSPFIHFNRRILKRVTNN